MALGSDDITKATLKNKAAAFEHAAKQVPAQQMKKTWKTSAAGGYKKETVFAGGPAPKKRMSELLAS